MTDYFLRDNRLKIICDHANNIISNLQASLSKHEALMEEFSLLKHPHHNYPEIIKEIKTLNAYKILKYDIYIGHLLPELQFLLCYENFKSINELESHPLIKLNYSIVDLKGDVINFEDFLEILKSSKKKCLVDESKYPSKTVVNHYSDEYCPYDDPIFSEDGFLFF